MALGVSMGLPNGSGTGPKYAREMAEALRAVYEGGLNGVDYVETFLLFIDGMAYDRISDLLCNVLKDKFITYTQGVCMRYRIPLELVECKNAGWSSRGGWSSKKVELPINPYINKGVLLVPKRFLKDMPYVSADKFWSWVRSAKSKEFRDEINYYLAGSLSKAEKSAAIRNFARKHPDVAAEFIRTIAEDDHTPYDIQNDPDLLVGWYEAGRKLYDPAIALPREVDPGGFKGWVELLIDRFRHAVEDQDGWKLCWNDNKSPRGEKIIQAVAQQVWLPYCKAANVDISREVDLGRGAVDFKFSNGWKKRALVELKLVRSTSFAHGAEKQLPQYLKSGDVELGYYVCIGLMDGDFKRERIDRVGDACRALSEQAGYDIKPILVDARPKPSASSECRSI